MHLFQQRVAGGLAVRCSICRHQALARSDAEAQHFFQLHSHTMQPAAAGYYGAGDAVTALTGALGIAQCSPCQQRAQLLNQLIPRLWRR